MYLPINIYIYIYRIYSVSNMFEQGVSWMQKIIIYFEENK